MRHILDDPAARYTWLATIVAGVIAMFVADDARVLIILWAAGGLLAAAVTAIRSRQPPGRR
jgi:hypothetical protein